MARADSAESARLRCRRLRLSRPPEVSAPTTLDPRPAAVAQWYTPTQRSSATATSDVGPWYASCRREQHPERTRTRAAYHAEICEARPEPARTAWHIAQDGVRTPPEHLARVALNCYDFAHTAGRGVDQRGAVCLGAVIRPRTGRLSMCLAPAGSEPSLEARGLTESGRGWPG